MNTKRILAGAASLALFVSAQATVYYVGDAGLADVTSVIDIGAQKLNGADLPVPGDLAASYGGTYTPATTTEPAKWQWGSSDTFILQEIVAVTNGSLIIDAGSVVRGQPKAAGDFNPGALVIAADAKLFADGGNAASPIVFTTAGVGALGTTRATTGDQNPAYWDSAPTTVPQLPGSAALWGGLVVLGRGPTNVDRDALIVAPAPGNAFTNLLGGTVSQIIYGYGYGVNKNTFDGFYTNGVAYTGQVTTIAGDDRSSIEGVPAASYLHTSGLDRFGGFEAADNSGVLNYLSIRHGGAELATNNELNGLTLGAVGAGTKISNIEIYGNTDDGIEWFGGNVNCDHLLVIGVQDDGLDIDVGYTGTIQFAVVIGGNASTGDKLVEWDGSYENETVNGFTGTGPVARGKTPVTGFNAYNLTLIGNLGGVAQGMNIRDQVSPRFVNSLVINPKASPIEIDNRTGVADSNDTLQNFKSGVAEIRAVSFYDETSTFANTATAWVAGVSNAGANATEVEVETVIGSVVQQNTFGENPGLGNLPNGALTASLNIDLVPDFNVAGTGTLSASIQPSPTNVVSASYRGAFGPDDTIESIENWATVNTWSAASKLAIIKN